MKSLITAAEPASSSLTSSSEKKPFIHTKPYHKTVFRKEKTVAVA